MYAVRRKLRVKNLAEVTVKKIIYCRLNYELKFKTIISILPHCSPVC
jgi:hypothetical protein